MEQGGSPYRALLLSDVVLGKVMKLKQDRPSLKEVRATRCAASGRVLIDHLRGRVVDLLVAPGRV